MDRTKAEAVFTEEILGRWPDFELSRVIYDDWMNLFTKFEPESIKRAAAQYVLNYDSYKKPALNKFKEILNAICGAMSDKKEKKEIWPKYFLQRESDSEKDYAYGTFTEINVGDISPDEARFESQRTKEYFQSLYGGMFRVIVCNNRDDVVELIKDRWVKTCNRIRLALSNRQSLIELQQIENEHLLSDKDVERKQSEYTV